MQTNARWSGPPVREVVWEAVQRFTGGNVDVEFAIKDIKWVALEMYPDFKVSNVGAEITAGCVNSASRHHHHPDIDRYWKVDRGVYCLYNPNQQVDLDEVLEKINEIAKVSENSDYIYRGEPECYKKVSSNLYREYETDIEAEHFDMVVIQEEILKEAKEYTIHKMDDTEILTELQHYGGKTNLIDFTIDYLVALFFACGGEPKEPGRVILLQRPSKVDPKPYEVEKPPGTIRRAEVQKSIFVQAPEGFVEPDKVVCIPSGLKRSMLDYLRKRHGISTKTIYNDLHGFIEKRRLHSRAYAAFHKGFTSHDRADSAKTGAKRQEWYNDAIIHYTKAIDLDPEYTSAYYNRGITYDNTGDFGAAIADYSRAIDLNPEDADAYYNRGSAYRDIGDFDAAIADYGKAIKLKSDLIKAYNNRGLACAGKSDFDAAIADYSRAIDLDSKNARAYCNRGEAWLHLKEWKKAKVDLVTAKNMGHDIITSFHNDYEGVEDFGAKNEVKVPKDIAELLQRK